MIYIRRTISALIAITLFALAIWGFSLLPYRGMIVLGSTFLVGWAGVGCLFGIIDKRIETFQPRHYLIVGPIGSVFMFLHWLFKSWFEKPEPSSKPNSKSSDGNKPSTF